MKKTTAVLFTGVFSLLLLAPCAIAQERPPNQSGCILLDKDRQSQFVSYDADAKIASMVTLRLHNNTSCGIVVETDDTFPTQLVRLPNNRVRLETITNSRDGIRLPLHYLIRDSSHRRAPEPAYGWGDSVYHYEILPGHSVVFSVPLAHFRKRFDIAVPFNYAWEGKKFVGRGAGGVTHLVYFLVEDIAALKMSTDNSRARL